MAVGGIVELFLGVRAEQQPLENIAKPITAGGGEEERREGGARRRAPKTRADRRNRERGERERLGLRRFRPGPGTASYSPFLAFPPSTPAWLDHEIAIIDRALQEHGELSRQALARRVGARYWGPGRFRAALREALREGAVRRASRSTYAAGPGGDDASGPGQPEPGLT